MSSMTAEPRTDWLPHRPLTRADLKTLPDDGHRYELIDGVLIVSPSPSRPHQTAVVMLTVRLFEVCPPEYRLISAPFDVVLAPDTVLQPDVLIAPRSQFTHQELAGAPALAVEVLSPSTRHLDLAFKRARLEAAGCRSYWVVDPLVPSIVCWELGDDGYVETARATGDEPISLERPFPIALIPNDLVD